MWLKDVQGKYPGQGMIGENIEDRNNVEHSVISIL